MPARARFPRSLPRADAFALPWRPTRLDVDLQAWLARFTPTRRSLAAGFGMLILALGAYLLARESSLFAIHRVEVHGAPRPVARQVEHVLRPFEGAPLVGLDGSSVLRKVEALPTVLRASYDRSFPHTLSITVVPEHPAAILRRGADSWLVSARGRVMERLRSGDLPRLPRIWISTRTQVRAGAEVPGAGTSAVAQAVGLAGTLAPRVASASYTGGMLVFHLRSGLELLLGDTGGVRLKVAVAKRVLGELPPGSTYLDVSMPGRAVSGTGSPILLSPKSSSRG